MGCIAGAGLRGEPGRGVAMDEAMDAHAALTVSLIGDPCTCSPSTITESG